MTGVAPKEITVQAIRMQVEVSWWTSQQGVGSNSTVPPAAKMASLWTG